MIVICGEALIDFIPVQSASGTECFYPSPGGSPYNTAVSISRLDVPAAFLGRMSRDFFGDMLVKNLEGNGVNSQLIVRSDEPTTLAFVKRSPTGEAQYAFYTNGSADRSLSVADLPREFPAEVKCIQFGSISLTMEPGAQTIMSLVRREAGKRVLSYDPNIRESMISDREFFLSRFRELAGLSTIVKISDADLTWIYPDSSEAEAVGKLRELGADLVVVTRGEKGSAAFLGDMRVESSAVRVTVSDTVGAGDSFHAAILSWLSRKEKLDIQTIRQLSEDDLRNMLRFAGNVSAITCSRPGANPPRLSELPPEVL